jgi:hypothetical protein
VDGEGLSLAILLIGARRSAKEDWIVSALIAVRWDLRALCWNINEFMGLLFFLVMHRLMQGIQERGNIKL